MLTPRNKAYAKTKAEIERVLAFKEYKSYKALIEKKIFDMNGNISICCKPLNKIELIIKSIDDEISETIVEGKKIEILTEPEPTIEELQEKIKTLGEENADLRQTLETAEMALNGIKDVVDTALECEKDEGDSEELRLMKDLIKTKKRLNEIGINV